jgi:uncharacterized Fe-S cluster-containing protein
MIIEKASAGAPANLPGLDCGLCGFKTCGELAVRLGESPGLIRRCIPKANESLRAWGGDQTTPAVVLPCTACPGSDSEARQADAEKAWHDSLGRPFDFYLEHFPEEPGPREIILPHNPALTRELDIQAGDVLIGRPLGMSCGCPVTHCGIVTDADPLTGVVAWCVTGPLQPRQQGFKDVGYYTAEAYEGLIRDRQCEIRIGMRYFFQPRMCMLQWRHSGLVNFLNRAGSELQVRLEGLWIG